MDSSFNSNIVSIHISDFIFLLEQFECINKEEILKEAKKRIDSCSDCGLPENFTGIIESMLVDLGGKYIGELTTKSICDFIKAFKPNS